MNFQWGSGFSGAPHHSHTPMISVKFALNHSYTLLIMLVLAVPPHLSSHITLCISLTGGPVCQGSQNAPVPKINPHFSPPQLDDSAPDLVVQGPFQGKWLITGPTLIYWNKLYGGWLICTSRWNPLDKG